MRMELRWSDLEAGCVHLRFKTQERVILSFSFSGMNQGFGKYPGHNANLLLSCWGHRRVEERGWRKEEEHVFRNSAIVREKSHKLVAWKSFPR